MVRRILEYCQLWITDNWYLWIPLALSSMRRPSNPLLSLGRSALPAISVFSMPQDIRSLLKKLALSLVNPIPLQVREKGTENLVSVFHINSVTHQLHVWVVCCWESQWFLKTEVKRERSSLFLPSQVLPSQSPRDPHGLSPACPLEMRV